MKTDNGINRAYDLTDESINRLDSISKWTRFLGISMYVITALLVLMGFYGFVLTDGRGYGGIVIFVVSIFVAIVFYYIGKYLKIGGDNISWAIEKDSPEALDQGVESLTSGIKICGWMTIVSIAICVFIFLFGSAVIGLNMIMK